MSQAERDVYKRFGLTPVINASGTMTALGASQVSDDVIQAMADILPKFVDMMELQARASRIIAEITGAEAGCVTACVASGIAIGIAAAMTGDDLGAVERIPSAEGLKTEVILQTGHVVDFGAQIHQMARISGASVRLVGTATSCAQWQIEGAIGPNTAAGLYVVSHHTVQSGLVDLRSFVEICHRNDVPVIVDAASEYDLESFIGTGADLVIYSGHKFLGGPTSGLIAGRKALVKACYAHQELGIGRAMKVGKESIVGLMATLERWKGLPHQKIQAAEFRRAQDAVRVLREVPGLRVEFSPDPTGNPITRVRVNVARERAGMTASDLSSALAAGRPSIRTRSHHVDRGYFELDPCNLSDEEMRFVCDRIRQIVEAKAAGVERVAEESDLTTVDAEAFVATTYRYSATGMPGADPERAPTVMRAPSRVDAVAERLAHWPDI